MYVLKGKRISGEFKAKRVVGEELLFSIKGIKIPTDFAQSLSEDEAALLGVDAVLSPIIAELQYPSNWLELASADDLQELGIEVIDDPVPESPETHDIQILDEYPWIICTPKPKEQIDAAAISNARNAIAQLEESQPRALREAVLTGNLGPLQEIDEAIKAQRKIIQDLSV